jgi:hypothetical protein
MTALRATRSTEEENVWIPTARKIMSGTYTTAP